MKREDIEKAAKDYRETLPYCDDAKVRGMYVGGGIGFIAGAEWMINSVWHDASEKPDMSKEIIVMYPDKSCRVFRPNGIWETLIELDKFIKWAYIEDLLPIK